MPVSSAPNAAEMDDEVCTAGDLALDDVNSGSVIASSMAVGVVMAMANFLLVPN